MIPITEILDEIEEDVDPEFIARLIDRATATLGREIGYYLGPPKEVVEFKYGRAVTIWLNDDPIADTYPGVAFTLERSWGPRDPYVVVDPTTYVVEGRRLIADSSCWAPSFRITYWAGFDPAGTTGPEPPLELQALVRQMVLDALSKAGAIAVAATDLKSETIGDYSYTRADVGSASVTVLGEDWPTAMKRWKRNRI